MPVLLLMHQILCQVVSQDLLKMHSHLLLWLLSVVQGCPFHQTYVLTAFIFLFPEDLFFCRLQSTVPSFEFPDALPNLHFLPYYSLIHRKSVQKVVFLDIPLLISFHSKPYLKLSKQPTFGIVQPSNSCGRDLPRTSDSLFVLHSKSVGSFSKILPSLFPVVSLPGTIHWCNIPGVSGISVSIVPVVLVIIFLSLFARIRWSFLLLVLPEVAKKIRFFHFFTDNFHDIVKATAA
nr:MAG TPA: hypothetical protein [Caudoviricetes sp.]